MQQKLTCSPIPGIFRGNCRETQLTCLDLDTCNHEIINLKFLKIGKFHRALRGPVGRPVPTPFSIVVHGLEKRRTTAGRSVRSYLQDGRTGRFGTLRRVEGGAYQKKKKQPRNGEGQKVESYSECQDQIHQERIHSSETKTRITAVPIIFNRFLKEFAERMYLVHDLLN